MISYNKLSEHGLQSSEATINGVYFTVEPSRYQIRIVLSGSMAGTEHEIRISIR